MRACWSLWALGVGAVISGEYYGWNFGLGTSAGSAAYSSRRGHGVMYYGLCY